MSSEFWYGTLLSAVLFVVGSIISVFGADIRQYYLAWRRDRQLRGTSLKLSKLRNDLAEHQRLAADPGAAAAFFWSGLFLVISVLMLLGLAAFIAAQLHTSIFRYFGAALFGIAWLMAYTVASALHRRAQQLRKPEEHATELRAKIASLEAQLPGS